MLLLSRSRVRCECNSFQFANYNLDSYMDSSSGSGNIRRSKTKLKFDHIDDLLAYIERISDDNHRTLGKWTAAQNFYHLAAAFEGSLEGLPAGYSPLIRFIARRFRWVVTRYRFPPWFPIPTAIRYSLGPPESCDFSAQKERFIQAIETFRRHTETHPPHPVLGHFTHDQWIGFHLRHCEHHLSFIAIGQRPV